MTLPSSISNRVKSYRLRQGWSQADLAAKATISRTAISAIENGQLSPSVTTALELAKVFGCSVETLFSPEEEITSIQWAWTPSSESCRYWRVRIGDQLWRIPSEPIHGTTIPHDGIYRSGVFHEQPIVEDHETLVVATCDPAVGLLATLYAQSSGFRLIPLVRSSQNALELLRQGKIHAAGIHFASTKDAKGNRPLVRNSIGEGYSLIHFGQWQSGICIAPGLDISSPSQIIRGKYRWVGREHGSAAQKCLDDILDHRPIRRIASDHRGVAEAVRHHWADAGYCHRLVAEEAGLSFFQIRNEEYDLCFAESSLNEARISALVQCIRSDSFQRLLGDLPGYDLRKSGDVIPVR
jgi:molybdate-binding protein/DNA-binding XRE family transcriptional regulator